MAFLDPGSYELERKVLYHQKTNTQLKNHSKYFRRFDRETFDFILKNADSVTYVNEKYNKGSMFARNRALVDGSDVCIAYLNALSGGTYYTVKYARQAKIQVMNLNKGL